MKYILPRKLFIYKPHNVTGIIKMQLNTNEDSRQRNHYRSGENEHQCGYLN